MTVVVTGATGFLGFAIVERLAARGDHVRAFCRKPHPNPLKRPNLPDSVEIFLGDIRNRAEVLDACRGATAVFHTAALAGIQLDRRPFYETNVVGTQNVLDACRLHSVPKLVFTGSPSVADGGVPLTGIDETVPYPKRYLAPYPETKGIAEQAVLAANGEEFSTTETSPDGKKRQKNIRFATCSLRPRLIWGPGDRHLIPRLIASAQKGKLFRVGDGTNRLDMIYIDDAADAHIKALDALSAESPLAGEAYFLSQAEPVNCWEFINSVLKLAGTEPPKRKISFRTAWRIGWCYEILYRLTRSRNEPPMTRFLATQLSQSYWFNTEKARRDFGFAPKVSVAEGLRQLGIWLKTQHRE